MNRKKTVFLILCIAALCFSGTGCKNKESVNSGKDTLELSMHMHFFGYCVYDNNWSMFKKAEELTGVKITGTASSTVSDSSQAFNMMLADEKLPDIIHYRVDELNKIGMDGALIPLDDLIEQYAPNIKRIYEEHPEFRKKSVAPDGKIYEIRGSSYGFDAASLPSQAWFVRQDWLDALGLKAPTTIDELYNVLKAFREKDPNGNGEKDEIPYFNRSCSLEPLLNLFYTKINWYDSNNDGQVEFGPVTDNYKTAMITLSKWYKEGLIDQELFSRGSNARDQLFSSNNGGTTNDWISSTMAYNSKFASSVDGFKLAVMAPPKDINGNAKEYLVRYANHSYGWGISKDNKNPIETIKYMDFWMSEVGCELNAYGVEGLHYNVIDGKKVFTDTVINAQEGVPKYMRMQGQVETGTIGSIESEYQGMIPEAQEAFRFYRDNNYCSADLNDLDYMFTKEEKDIISAYYTNIKTYINEQTQKWFMGEDTINDATWNNYIKTLEGMKLKDIQEIYQKAYRRYLDA